MHAIHHAAVLARLRAHAKLANKVDSGIRLSTEGAPVRANYVATTTTLPGFEEGRLTSEQSTDGDAFLFARTRVVATDYDGLLELLDAVGAQMVGHRLAVEGRALTAFERSAEEPVHDPVSRLWYVDVLFEATSSRAVV